MINIIALCSVFLCLCLFTFLLWKGKLSGSHYTVLLITIILSGFALYGFDRLKELDLKNLKIILAEIKEVRRDVYAKADTVKKLGEEMAELTAFTVTRVGRFSQPDLKDKMVENRDKITSVLKELGSDEFKIKNISKQIDDILVHDLKSDLLSSVQKAAENITTDGEKIKEIYKQTQKLLLEGSYDRNRITDYLKSQKVYKPEVEPLFDQIDEFN
ncbi:MAG: hypothetical protein WBE75_03330 [Candidatus Omnitrophota bacterium]